MMPGTPLAEAFVRVRALTDRFKDDVQKGFEGVGDDFGKQFSREASARLRDERGRFAAAGAGLGDAAGESAGEQLARRMAELAAARLRADGGRIIQTAGFIGEEGGEEAGERFGQRMAEAGAVRLGRDGNAFVPVGRQVGGDAGEAAGQEFSSRFWRDVNGRLRDARGRFVAEGRQLGEGAGEGAGDGFNRGFRRATGDGGFGDGLLAVFRRLGDLGRSALDGMLPSLSRLASGFGSAASAAGGLLATTAKWGALAAGVSALAAAAASSAGWVVELAAALAPLSGLLAGLPGIAVTGAAAMGVWKLATSGLMESISAALAYNDKALAAASAKLSKTGQEFIQEFLLIRGQFSQFKDEAQGAFLEPIIGQLQRWIDSAQRLQPALAGVAGEFGQIVRIVLDFATSNGGIEQLNSILGGTRDLVAAVRGALDPLLRGFFELGVVGNSWLASFAPALQSVLTTFGEWMSEIARSGVALGWLQDATVVLQQLGRLVKDVWQTFTGLLGAANAAGSSALGVLGQLVGAMNKWVNSAKGQEILVTIFKALHQIGEATIPVITALAGAVALIAPQIARIAEVALPILAKAIDALGPAIAAVGPGLTELISGIGRGISALAPALEPLGKIVGEGLGSMAPLFESIGRALSAAMPGLKTFIQLLTDALGKIDLAPLGAALGDILAAAGPLAAALGPVLAQALEVLAKGVSAMGPGLVRMVESFGDMVTAIGPLEPLGRALGGVFAAIGGAAALIVPELAKIAVELAPALTNAIKALAPALVQLSPGLQEIAKHLAKAFADPALADGLLKLGKGISDVLIAAAPLLPVIAQLAGILGQVLGGALTNLGVALGPIITALASALEPALGAISRALAVLIPYMEPIYKAFGDIGAALITQLLPPLLNLVPVIIDSLIPAFADFLTQLQPLIPLLADLAVKLIQQVLPAILPILPQLADLSVQIAAVGLVLAKLVADVAPFVEKIIGFFQRLYDTLVGHSIIPDLINGIRDWFQKGIDWVLGIVDGFGKIPERIGQWLGQAVSQVQNKWSEIRSTIDGKINEISGRISSGLDAIRSQWNSVWEGVRNFVGDQFNQIRNAVNGGIDGVVGYFRDLPNRVRGAVGDLGGVLYDSGRSLMQGLINGIYSMWQTAYNAATDVLNHLRSLFPFSPAKDGPFSGKGWTLYSGRSMMTGLASGIASQQAAVTGALDSVLSAGAATLGAGLQVPLSGMAGATAAPDFAGVLGAPAGAPAVVGPTRGVSVQGDLHVHVQGVFDPSNPVGYRRMIEGVRAAIIDLEREEYAGG